MSTGNNRQNITVPKGCQPPLKTTSVPMGKIWSGGNDPTRTIPQSYSMDHRSSSRGTITWWRSTETAKQAKTGTFQDCFGTAGFTTINTANDMQLLLNRLAAQVRGHDFSAGISLGEANESLRMIGNRARKIAKDADDLERKFRNSIKRFIPAAAYLEAVYGWLPLLVDVKSGAEALAHHLNKPRKKVFRATLKNRGGLTSASPTKWVAGGKNIVSYRGQCTLIEDQSFVANLQLDDPASIAWNLMPYTFVADWFLPIGGWLQARNFLAKTKATYVISKLHIQEGRCVQFIGSETVKGFGSLRNNVTTFTRTVGVPTLPLPRFRKLSDVLSNWRHCVDALALVDQRVRNAANRVR